MYGLKRKNLFLCEPGGPMWRPLIESHGKVLIKKEFSDIVKRYEKLSRFYIEIPIEIHQFSDEEIEELFILKLKG